eukprot:m.89037 g.89037  ORF g.89037 m.89037 type:complete len:189 (+) comp26255_c0_seq2:155-721(+)
MSETKSCGICGCDDFSANPFKKDKCKTCGHDHSGSVDDLPIWERENLVTETRERKEKQEQLERDRLRALSQTTMKERPYHSGQYASWFKLVGSDKGYRAVEMGKTWTCCQGTKETDPPCSAGIISDLHQPCFQCSIQYLPFELPRSCRYHGGKLHWKEMGGTKYRWDCCDRLANEEGCKTHYTHIVKS